MFMIVKKQYNKFYLITMPSKIFFLPIFIFKKATKIAQGSTVFFFPSLLLYSGWCCQFYLLIILIIFLFFIRTFQWCGHESSFSCQFYSCSNSSDKEWNQLVVSFEFQWWIDDLKKKKKRPLWTNNAFMNHHQV